MATVRERVIEMLRAVPSEKHNADLSRAYEAGFEDGNDEPPSGTLQSFGYRRASAGSVRDFGGLDYTKVLDTAWRVFLLSPLARRYLQVKRDYELGRGVEPKSDDDALTEHITAFWDDNGLRSRIKTFALQWHLLGEQLYPAFVRATDGRVRLGYIDPVEIDKVITHPDNVLERWAVVLKQAETNTDEPWVPQEKGQRVYRLIRKADEGDNKGRRVLAEQTPLELWEYDMLKAYKLDAYTGSAFYFPRNALSNQPRGYTDLLQVADWIDQGETVLFDLAERENFAGYFVGDVTLESADEVAITKRAGEIRRNPPKKGSWNVHNEKETWNLSAPDLKQQPSIETADTLETFILGGLGLPRHWFGHGDETNRATAQAQGDPTWRTMENDQDAIKDMIVALLEFCRDQAEIAGNAKWQAGGAVDVQMPEMTSRDLVSNSNAAATLTTALMVAVEQGWMTQEHAAEMWALMASEFGIEMDAQEELKAVAVEQQAAAMGQQTALGDWFSTHGMVVAEEQPAVMGG